MSDETTQPRRIVGPTDDPLEPVWPCVECGARYYDPEASRDCCSGLRTDGGQLVSEADVDGDLEEDAALEMLQLHSAIHNLRTLAAWFTGLATGILAALVLTGVVPEQGLGLFAIIWGTVGFLIWVIGPRLIMRSIKTEGSL